MTRRALSDRAHLRTRESCEGVVADRVSVRERRHDQVCDAQTFAHDKAEVIDRGWTLAAGHQMRPVRLTLIILAALALGAVLLVPLLFTAKLPTTFHCRDFMDRSPEAKLVYPGGHLLSYTSREGSRDLIQMSSPPGPAFFAFQAISNDDHGEFRWFDEQLQKLGWRPLDPKAQLQVAQTTGETTRGDAEAMFIQRFARGGVPAYVDAPPVPEGQALLRIAYFVIDNAPLPECR
ncbi:MAG: hypothetical protein M3T56_13625 [Chloroflexota bacterium]|nr:hypothetical protein [Chloroflexota bacterium]